VLPSAGLENAVNLENITTAASFHIVHADMAGIDAGAVDVPAVAGVLFDADVAV
jgi:hypothetical protein